MSSFIQLKSAKPEAIARYRRELRAIVVDRAADHTQQVIARYKRPTARSYEKALQDGLLRAKLDVLAELFGIMHNLARPNVVAQWSRKDTGLQREVRSPQTTMELLKAYDQLVRYVSNMKAQRKRT